MNKISILGLSAFMALGFAACDGYEEPNPAPTTNEQESIVKPSEVSFTNDLSATDVADLRALNNEEKPLVVATVTGVIPEGYEFLTKTELSADGGATWFAVPTETVLVDGQENTYNVTVSPDQLDGLYCANVTRDPATVSVDARYKLYTVTGGMTGLIDLAGNQGWLTNSFELKPMGPGYVIEDNYYLVLNGDLANAIKLSHDDEAGVNRYDNAMFSAVVELPGSVKWQVVPESTVAAGNLSDAPYAVWGVAADAKENLSAGELVANVEGTPCTAGVFGDANPYQFKVNLYDRTFDWSMALINIYCTGTHNKNNPKTATPMGTTDYATYFAYVPLAGGYRFLGQPSNTGLTWGYDGEDKDLLQAQGTTAFPAVKGMCYVEANIVKLTNKVVPVTTIGVIGDATPGGWDADTDMTPVAGTDNMQWEGDITFTDGTFKFRANDGWDVNLGGALGNLTPGGDNIAVTAGTYHVVLYLDALPIAATLTAK